MLGQYPSERAMLKLNSVFNGATATTGSSHQEENNFSTIKIKIAEETHERTDTSFTTQSSQLVVDEPSTILTTSIFPTAREQYDDGRPFNSFQTTDGKAAKFPTITTTTLTLTQDRDEEEALSFISAPTSSVTLAPATLSSQEQEHHDHIYYNYVQKNSRHLSSSITTETATTSLQLQKQLPNLTMENDVDIYISSSFNNYPYNNTNTTTTDSNDTNNTTIDIFQTTNSTTTEIFPSFPNDTIDPITQEFQIYASLLCIIACIGIVGNSSVIHLIFREFQLNIKTHFTNMFILSLAVADVIVCTLVAFPASVSMAVGEDPTSGFICGIQCMANYMTIIASIGTLTIISVDRFISVRWPLHYHKWVTSNRLRTALVTVWIQALIASTHAVSHTKTVEYEDAWKILCVTNWSTSTDSIAFGIFSLLWFIITPVLIIICANTILLRHIFMGNEEEAINAVMTLKRQNAFRGVAVVNGNPSANPNQNEVQQHNESRFTVHPVILEPPKPFNAWANMTNVRFHMQSPAAQNTDDDEREIQLFSRVDPFHTIVNNNCNNLNSPTMTTYNISSISGNERIVNTDVTSDQVLKCYLVVTSVYLVLHFPTFVLFIIKHASDIEGKTPGGISYFSFFCHLIAAFLNPFLYASLRKDFRRSFHELFKKLPAIDFNR